MSGASLLDGGGAATIKHLPEIDHSLPGPAGDESERDRSGAASDHLADAGFPGRMNGP
jgi:hypothetical protein